MRVSIFKLHFEESFIKDYQEGCKKILESGMLTNSQHVKVFEQGFTKVSGTEHALAVNSGTGALEIALRAVGVHNKKVIIPTNTFIATAVAVENAGGEIYPIDIEDQTFALDVKHLKKALEENDDVAAVILVHIGGLISQDIEDIAALCQKQNVPLIEDAAHAQGSEHNGKKAGSFGLAGCFSFFPTKVMTTAEGGIVTTNSKNLYEQIRSIRQFGQDMSETYLHVRGGSNFKMTEFQGLLGQLELKRLDSRIERRTQLASICKEELQGGAWTVIGPLPHAKSSYYKQIMTSSLNNDAARKLCLEQGIELTGEVYRYPIHRQPVYQKRFEQCEFPVSDKFCSFHICPPLYPELEDKEMRYVCSVLKRLDVK